MIIIPLLLLLASSTATLPNWHYVTFDEGMHKESYPQAFATTEKIVGINGHKLYDFFKEIYEKNNFSVISPHTDIIIPKTIHQIWLGKSKIPEAFKEFQQTWIEHHMGKGWNYKLWTDEDVEELILHNREFYDATDNYGVKSDILRWEILYTYGGVYIDMDYECLAALDDFHYTYDFYTAVQPLDTQFVQLGAALVGSRPHHPILKHCIETIKDDWHYKGAPTKTGPVHFTKSFYACAGMDNNKDIALPAFYFYPLAAQATKYNKSEWITQGAFAVHWWAKSWMPKKYRPAFSYTIDNDESAQSWND
jgi:mannosyltransferase OCH1-like enzyme